LNAGRAGHQSQNGANLLESLPGLVNPFGERRLVVRSETIDGIVDDHQGNATDGL